MKTQVRKGLLLNYSLYIRTVFGDTRHKDWIKKLGKNAAQLYSSGIFKDTWYEAEEFFIQPAYASCKLFDSGRTNCVWNSGSWGVETWLKGWVRHVFNILSPEQLLKYFLPVSATYYYKPVRIVKISIKTGEAVIYIEGMHGAESMLAYRFGGGLEKALQIKGCNNVLIQISTSHEMFPDTTVFFINWEK